MKKLYILLGTLIILSIMIGTIVLFDINNHSNVINDSTVNDHSTQDADEPQIPPKPPDQSSEQRFVGSINSDVYHYPSCGHAGRIKPWNEIWFSSSQDARNHGYRPCKVCCPP